jgi:predicted DNA-binding transcriptional regulator AlpA
MSETLLTPEQAALLLHLKTATLARWRWAGCGPRFIKIGGRVRYSASEIEAFIQAGVRTSTSDPGPADASAAS